MTGSAIVARARACVGARFRVQGRNPDFGLDCAGLVLVALGAAGRANDEPRDYALGGDRLLERIEGCLATGGGVLVASATPGDVMLFEPVAGQGHLAIASERGVIQAHLGIRRVVESPADPAWRVHSIWRFGAGD